MKSKIEYLQNIIFRQSPTSYKIAKKQTTNKQPKIIGMIRERNESLILKDTLDHVSNIVDGIVVFDDASTDESVEIALNHPNVLEVIINKKWQPHKRAWEETANRRKLLSRTKRYQPDWFFYFDADERFEGDIRNYLLHECPPNINAIKISLFDAYITNKDKKSYRQGDKLFNFRKFFGPEKRDILMIWRNNGTANFIRPDAREPQGFTNKQKITKFYCQHYGKSISIEHWEQTCRYYAEFFPKYSEKWRARLGKAIHESSDFGNKLYRWHEVKSEAIPMELVRRKA